MANKFSKEEQVKFTDLVGKEKANKEFRIKNNLFKAVLDKKIVLENLYTGYESEIYRYAVEEYNRDIIMYLDMFGYKFKKS